MAEVTIINISWEKIPFDLDLIRKKNLPSDYGLYQIYGQHPAYGENALLYIGKSENQKFGTRLDKRWEFVESCARPTSIYLGRIIKSKNEILEWDINLWRKMINDVEILLIRSHTPAFNKKENSGLYSHDLEQNLLVFNWDDRGALLPEISTLRYSFKYWEYDIALEDDE